MTNYSGCRRRKKTVRVQIEAP